LTPDDARGQAGDGDQTLVYFQRSLEVAEKLLRDNPQSAQASCDLMVSLERMAGITGAQPGEEPARQALEFQIRALGIAWKLQEGNPQSAYFGRTAAVLFFFTFQRAQSAGQEELAAQSLGGCHAVLHQLVIAGGQLDPPMMDL